MTCRDPSFEKHRSFCIVDRRFKVYTRLLVEMRHAESSVLTIGLLDDCDNKVLRIEKLHDSRFIVTGTRGSTVCGGHDLNALATYICSRIEPYRPSPIVICNNYFAHDQLLGQDAVGQIAEQLRCMAMINDII